VGHQSLRLDADALGEDFADAFYLGSDAAQFFFDALVASVDVVDAVDDGFVLGDEGASTRDAEARRSLASTAAPLRVTGPRTTARRPRS